MPAAAFSPRKANMTFYVGDGFEGAAELYARLGKHKKSVACLYVNKLMTSTWMSCVKSSPVTTAISNSHQLYDEMQAEHPGDDRMTR